MIPAIVLAAGSSSRMGRPKALLPIGSDAETFLSRILRILREGGIQNIVVVLGGDAAAIRRTLPPEDVSLQIVENEHHHEGQLSSLLVGLRQIGNETEGVMVALVDMPLVSANTVTLLLEAFRKSPEAPLFRPRKGNRCGHPVIFHQRLFAELQRANLSTGAKPIVSAHRHDEVDVAVSDDGIFIDIDTPEDYARLVGSTPVLPYPSTDRRSE